MGRYASLDAIPAGLQLPPFRFFKITQTTKGAGFFHNLAAATGIPVAMTTPPTGAGEVPTKATAGSFNFTNATDPEKVHLVTAGLRTTVLGSIDFYDVLWRNSGFVANINTVQTVTTPTLTRPDANGANCEIWGQVYSATGATGTTWTVSYTNQDGTADRSATYVSGTSGLNTVGQVWNFALAAGDTGVQAIASITLTATTGTAGNFGLMIMRKIATIGVGQLYKTETIDALNGALREVNNDAYIVPILACSTTTSGEWRGDITFGTE